MLSMGFRTNGSTNGETALTSTGITSTMDTIVGRTAHSMINGRERERERERDREREREREKERERERESGAQTQVHNQTSEVIQRKKKEEAFKTCSLHISMLSAGQLFRGIQMVKSRDTWNVNVVIQHCDIEGGYLCGTMEAVNVPNEKSSVLTFWEGEIINDVEKFWTKQWSATRKTDLSHWGQFPAFASIKKKMEKEETVEPEDILGTHVFMRWKERFFVKVGLESRITIAGFYYICFCRAEGTIDGYYYDPLSSPFQRLRLQSSLQGQRGYGFPEYSFN